MKAVEISPQDWPRLRAHFETLCDLAPAARAAALAALDEPPALRTALLRMLEAEDAADLDRAVADHLPALVRAAADAYADTAAEALLGQRLGAWRIEAIAGSGGMGHVYRARRDDGRFEALAAIKIVASGLDSQRFLHERALLARLDHPGIARLLDGGECEDGRPYLVMEYIDGVPIDQWCDMQGASLRERVRCVLDAARAAAYAQARAVLHRDLKPSNVLVDRSGQVKLLDFGVAKLLETSGQPDTQTSARYFTPAYAAPEQLLGEPCTTATDVFALAVMLYELLSGRHPFAGAHGPGGLAQRVLSEEATPLRGVLARGALPGLDHARLRDLEAVLQHALQRDSQLRYAGAGAFADELQRILADQPVLARTPGLRERWLRNARRHRLATAMGAVAVTSLLLGSGLALWQSVEARQQRDLALQEAARAERVGTFLADIFRASNPAESRGAELSARELLDRGRQRIAEQLGDDPALRHRLQRLIADTYRSLGLYDDAESLLQEALAQDPASSEPTLRAQLLSDLGWLHAFQGRHEDSAARLRHSIELVRSATAHEAQETLINALQRLATPLINLAEFDAAENAAREALALNAEQSPVNLERQAGLQSLLASVAFGRGRYDEAQALYRATLETQRALYGPEHTAVGVGLSNLATVAFRKGDLTEAERLYRQAIDLQRAYFGVDNAQVAAPLASLGLALRRLGRGAEALATLREAAAIQVGWHSPGHPLAVQAALDAVEVALLIQADASDELRSLTPALAALAPDSVAHCRGLAAQAQARLPPSDVELRSAVDCLEAARAPAAVRAQAWLALARQQPEHLPTAELQINALQPRDGLLDAALLRLKEGTATAMD
jgi:serine/threonine protein kinase